ncbi:MAG: hypothetical protein A2Z01_01915 [Betaproteobacteria bacterium RBG_16_58_11]|nr:MAG: hypothetical protein A2Z01_01915 [Betaproteobacteria bacterium RBG_16_58_11]OFZ99668.1 MAG: hypothetical protein A2Z44_05755 [Betaproteobacteria bacterium RBG_19FT_COMBO_58_11]
MARMMNPNSGRFPDMRHMRTFVAVVDAKGFSNAAEKLFMTQPGVSVHVQKLEEVLGYKLLERYPRKVMLTPSGMQFYKFCLSLFDQLTDTVESMAQGVSQVHGWLKLATPGSFGGILLQHLSHLQVQYPLLQFSVHYQPNEVILRDLYEGRLDVGFVTEESRDESFCSEKILEEEVVIFAHKHHKACAINTKSDIGEMPFIDYPDRRQLLDNWLSHHFGKHNFNQDQMQFKYFVNNLEAVIQLVAKQQGCSVIPLSAIDSHALKNELVILKGPRPDPLKQSIFWTLRSNQYISKRIHILRNSFLPG